MKVVEGGRKRGRRVEYSLLAKLIGFLVDIITKGTNRSAERPNLVLRQHGPRNHLRPGIQHRFDKPDKSSDTRGAHGHRLCTRFVQVRKSAVFIPYLYGPLIARSQDDLVISFNGGKDCTVLLHLYAAVLSKREVKTRIRAVYIPLPSPYEELESFIQESVVRYNLDLFHCLPTMSTSGDQLPVESVKGGGQRYRGGEGMRKALEVYKEKFPQVEGILMGTRRTDPDGSEHLSINRNCSNDHLRVIVFPKSD